MIGLVLLGLAVAAALSGRLRKEREETPRHTANDLTSPESLYAQAIRLGNEGSTLESLQYFARAGERGLAGRYWEYHFDYAASLHNLCVQADERRGVRMPAVRSSIERVALMRQALLELERAERTAATPRDKSRVLSTRAQILRFWGLPWNAVEQLRMAQFADRSQEELARSADAYMLLLKDPRPPSP